MIICDFCSNFIEQAEDYCPIYFCNNCGATIYADEFECQLMSDDLRITVVDSVFIFLSGKFLLTQ